MKDPTHRYQFSIAEGRQTDARNPFRNIREVPYERAFVCILILKTRFHLHRPSMRGRSLGLS